MRRSIPAALAATLLAPPAPGLELDDYRLVDLSHSYNEDTLYWPGSPSTFEKKQLAYGVTDAGYFYSANAVCTAEHGGTHLDAPLHFAAGGTSADELPLENLVAPAVVIDVSGRTARERNYRLTVDDVRAFEERHGRIEPGTIVLMRSGWSRYWPNVLEYLGDDTPGDASKLEFPGFGEAAARLLVLERQVALLGLDTASIDYGRSSDFVVHRLAAANGVGALENLTNLDRLPPVGTLLFALPMKIEGGSGGPVRVVALVPR